MYYILAKAAIFVHFICLLRVGIQSYVANRFASQSEFDM